MHSASIIVPESLKALGGRERKGERERERKSNCKKKKTVHDSKPKLITNDWQ